MPEYTVKKEDIMVKFQGVSQAATQAVTQAATQAAENAIPVRIKKVIQAEPFLSQRQIAGLLGEKYDTIKYYMRKMRLSGVIAREGTSQRGRWILRGERDDETEL